MFYIQISFFIVLMLYVLCFAHGISDDDEANEDANVVPNYFQPGPDVVYIDDKDKLDVGPSHVQQNRSNFQLDLNVVPIEEDVEMDGFTNCLHDMMSVFEKNDPLSCIRTAIKNLVLYDTHKTECPYDVENYCKTFHLFLKLNLVKTPKIFCYRDKHPDPTINALVFNPQCYEQIKFFEDIEDMDYGGEQNDLKKRVVMNALYYHKIGRNASMPDDKLQYFHVSHSHGLLYMNHIARNIRLNTRGLDSPWKYCKKVYNPDQ